LAFFVYVYRFVVPVSPDVVVHTPVLDDDYTALKHDDEPLCYKDFQVIVSCANHAQYLLGIVDKAIIVSPHRKVKVQGLRRCSHVKEGIRINDLF
jgi:hypothetical protein